MGSSAFLTPTACIPQSFHAWPTVTFPAKQRRHRPSPVFISRPADEESRVQVGPGNWLLHTKTRSPILVPTNRAWRTVTLLIRS